jgi:hypothetical protein
MKSVVIMFAFAVGLAAAAAVVAQGAQSGSSELAVRFITSDRNIECLLNDPNTTNGNVECVLHSKGYTTRGDSDNHGLTAHYHPRWVVSYSQTADREPSHRELGSSPLRILRDGHTLRDGYFSCTWRDAGLTCTSRQSKHGFFLSRTAQRTF